MTLRGGPESGRYKTREKEADESKLTKSSSRNGRAPHTCCLCDGESAMPHPSLRLRSYRRAGVEKDRLLDSAAPTGPIPLPPGQPNPLSMTLLEGVPVIQKLAGD